MNRPTLEDSLALKLVRFAVPLVACLTWSIWSGAVVAADITNPHSIKCKAMAVHGFQDVQAAKSWDVNDRLADPSLVFEWRPRTPEGTVIEVDGVRVQLVAVTGDSVLAMNFSYYIFKTREGLLQYFKRARSGLVSDGMLVLDAYGGSDSFVEMEERRKVDGFTYVWDQHSYNPITGDVVNYIHYEFPDGSRMSKAFAYEWRLWTLPELQELLYEAGFSKVTVYWEGTDKDGEGNDEFTATTVGEACPGWIAYLVAEK